MRKKTYITATDLFCGAGGSSQGATKAGAEVVMAVNHWQLAVDTHATNFPKTAHDCNDISQADPRRYPATDILIASPECTNHSLAKGRKRNQQAQLELWNNSQPDPAEERSRATMWDVPRFAEYNDYRAIIVENVVDARKWKMWDAWIHAMQLLGYEHEIVYTNSMFHWPTPQSRDRMYVVFWKGIKRPNLDYRPQAYCPKCEKDVKGIQAWKNPRRKWGRYGARNQYIYCCPTCAGEAHPYYYPAATAIDWTLPGERIGDRQRPLRDRTIQRIKYGLDKFGKQAQVVQLDHTNSDSIRTWPVTKALPTQTSRQVLAFIAPFLMQYYNRGENQISAYRGIDDPMPTLSTQSREALIQPFLMQYYTREGKHGNPSVSGADEEVPTVTTEPRNALIVPPFLLNCYGGAGWEKKNNGVDEGMTTVTTVDHHALITPFLAGYHGSGMNVAEVTDPIATVDTHDRQALIAPQIEVEDCFFRMLRPHEIGRAMAFPDNYVVLGNSREQVKQYGNAVTPPAMDFLTGAVMEALA